MDLFETIANTVDKAGITDIRDLGSEFMSTEACCEEGACCTDPA